MVSNYRAKKRFGQHFLTDPCALDNIIAAIHAGQEDHLVEIGPGRGALTERLIRGPHKWLDLIEIDRDLIAFLKQKFTQTTVSIQQADATELSYNELVRDRSLRMVGNLPYNVSTPLIFKLLDVCRCIQDMHFLLQKEVVDRLTAAPGDRTYSRLSVMVQYHCQAESLFTLGGEAFSPPPRVDSAFVRLTPIVRDIKVLDYQIFSHLVRDAFNQRRKTLSNGLKGWCGAATIASLGIDPKSRPQQCTVNDYIRLSNNLIDK